MRSLVMLVLLGALAACSQETPLAPTTPVSAFAAGDPPQTPGPLAGSDGALGSGCAPGAGSLPDGAWYGYAVDWDTTGIEFDLACFYTGAAAAAQATARNDESPPPNDFYLVNEGRATRRVDVGSDVAAYRMSLADGGASLEKTTYSDLVIRPGAPNIATCPGEWCAFWVFVNDGRVTEVMQQYLP